MQVAGIYGKKNSMDQIEDRARSKIIDPKSLAETRFLSIHAV
jgi:hypothetical protein